MNYLADFFSILLYNINLLTLKKTYLPAKYLKPNEIGVKWFIHKSC